MSFDFHLAAAATLLIYATFASLERIPGRRFRSSPFLRTAFSTDVAWYVAALTINLLCGPALENLALWRARIGLPGFESLGLPFALLTALSLVVYDFAAMVSHRMLHRFDALWRFHKVHHSSRTLDWLATTRAHSVEHLLRGVPTQALLFALGFPAQVIASTLVIYIAFATFGHSNLRLGPTWVEAVFVTPRLHRLHHVPATTDHNFGTVFTVWDRLCGCFTSRDTLPATVFGVPGEEASYPQTWWHQALQPFRRESVGQTDPAGITPASKALPIST